MKSRNRVRQGEDEDEGDEGEEHADQGGRVQKEAGASVLVLGMEDGMMMETGPCNNMGTAKKGLRSVQ